MCTFQLWNWNHDEFFLFIFESHSFLPLPCEWWPVPGALWRIIPPFFYNSYLFIVGINISSITSLIVMEKHILQHHLSIMLSKISLLRSAATTVARRGMATEAAHRPPLDLYGLNARYANATYTAASKADSLEKVEGELLAIKNSAENSKEFASFLENPLISRNEKTKSIEGLLKGKTESVTMNLMTTLAGNARLNNIVGITDSYITLMKAKRGEVEATIISAEPLNKTQTAAVSDAMQSQFPKGAKVVLKTEVNPSILGGLQIQIGDKFLDLSVGSRIEEVGRTSV